jgi:hypothetical protein
VTELHIERLALQVPGLSEREARRLAELVGDGLAAGAARLSPGAKKAPVKGSVTAEAGQDVSWLARAIVAEVLRQVERGG